MDLTQKFSAFTLLGANWVLWLLVGLSVLSVAIMAERLYFLFASKLPLRTVEDLKKRLGAGDLTGARELLRGAKGIEALVALEGLSQLGKGPDSAAEAMNGVRARERIALERNLAILGTLGNNAPFIGLFGTVLGIIKSFHDLALNQGGGASVVMSGLSEALVATAVGLLVAIPAVMAFNFFQRRVRARLAATDELAHCILAEGRSGAARAS